MSAIRHVTVVDNVWIPLTDGTRLAARLWLPETPAPVAAVLEYLPYRKNDAMALHDARNHGYLAQHGFACVRVDIRGSGDSDGVMLDEYAPQEQDDALEVIDWIARQPWCTGSVGMMGISWGGFNALQIAARRPAALKAVISAGSTDDRYRDDVHYVGGCVHAEWILTWASLMLAFNARPPDPAVSGTQWRDKWLERLHAFEPVVHEFLSHQRRDAYWKHGSVCEQYEAIECPVFMIGGWADRYTNGVLSFLERHRGPRKGLIGPWLHMWPQEGVPGPAVGGLQEAVRWFDHWLNGAPNGIMDEPTLTVYVQDSIDASAAFRHRPGRWVGFRAWPRETPEYRLPLSARGLGHAPARNEPSLRIRGAQVTGLRAGDSTGFLNPEADLPGDQRIDDGLSMCFTSDALAEPLEIVGRPTIRLTVESDRPSALLCVRLCDVSPTGASTLITRGLLNLTHRDGHEQPTALEPGQPYEVELELKAIAYRVLLGRRLRVALSPTYWPWAWPSPEPVTLTLRPRNNELVLPLGGGEELGEPFEPADAGDEPAVEVLEPAGGRRAIEWDMGERRAQLVRESNYGGSFRIEANQWETRYRLRDTFSIVEDEPTSATVRCEQDIANGRGDWQVEIMVRTELTCDANDFKVRSALDVRENRQLVFTRAWTKAIPRDLV